jgi:hypothetical protein
VPHTCEFHEVSEVKVMALIKVFWLPLIHLINKTEISKMLIFSITRIMYNPLGAGMGQLV